MEKINWENGTIINDAYVEIDGQQYTVTPEEVDGTTPLDADNLNLMQDNIEDAIEELKQQKVLWSGGWHMTTSHTANLTETITTQKNGIVLIWSHYNPSSQSIDNWGWNIFYIPKTFVNLSNGEGVTQIMSTTPFNEIAVKYVYIFNDKITGHNNNNQTGTNSGINYKNNLFVLRYVIGV